MILSMLSQKSSKLMKIITDVKNHFGLSKNGINIMKKLGLAVNDKTRLREENKNLILYTDLYDNMIKTKVTIKWIDNFSKIYFSKSISPNESTLYRKSYDCYK